MHPQLNLTLTENEAANLAKAIHSYYVGSDHGDVRSNQNWKRIYQAKQRPLLHINSAGGDQHVLKDSVPCHNCGIVVSFSDMQVDHHMPQVGGNFVLKMFRALDLTTQGPSGKKGNAIQSGNLNTLVIHPKSRPQGDYNHLSNATAQNKWTTNGKGEVFLSLFKYINAFDDLERFCKNSILNLVPLCRACNGQKSDWVRPIR